MQQRILRLMGVALALGVAEPAWAGLSPAEQRIAAWVDAQGDAFARDLEAAVRIDSATENHAGIRALAEHFAAQLRELGFEANYVPQPESTGRAGHLVAERRGDRGRRVLLIGHLDTVLPGGKFTREGPVVRGSGVADMKGGDVVVIHALRALHAAGQLDGAQVIVVFTGDEEAAGHPHELSRQALFAAAARSDVALAFESAMGPTATVARRGSISWELVVQGPTGHSSGIFSPPLGDGAAYELVRILGAFREQMRALDGATLNTAMIAAGLTAELTRTGGQLTGKGNIVPQRAVARGDLRTVSAEQLADAQARMRAALASNLPRTSAELTFFEGYPAMPPSPANYALLAQLDAASRDLGLGPITAFDPRARGAGDISFVSPPLPALDGLGLDGPGQHSADEAANLRQAPALVKRAAVMILRLAGEKPERMK